jgi:hypothetical protein
MAQDHFGNSIYQEGETLKEEPDEEKAIANVKEKEERYKPSIVSNDEDSNWPHWLGKYVFMPTPDEIDPSDRVCYVHVGKTAGSTMACELGFAYEGKEETTTKSCGSYCGWSPVAWLVACVRGPHVLRTRASRRVHLSDPEP